jgi:hypothetical protein
MNVVNPDGSRFVVDLNHDRLRFMEKWMFTAWLEKPSGQARFHVGPVGANEEILAIENERIKVEVASLGEMRLVSVQNHDEPQTMFLAQGPSHELYTTFEGTGIPFEAFVDFLGPLEILDTTEGMIARPNGRSWVKIYSITAVNQVADVAVVQLFPIDQVLDSLPPGKGRVVAGGELWQIPGSETGQGSALVLASDSAAATISPVAEAVALDALTVAEALVVTHQGV